MNEDTAFVRAICDDPSDETARLAYTDWLAERGDPRARYLATEAAWAALKPGGERYRSLYRQVSESAAGLDPEWLVAVGRIAHAVRAGWDAVAHLFSPESQPGPARAWRDAAPRLRALIAEAFGAEVAARRFCLPVDFVAFMSAVGEFHYPAEEMVQIAEWHAEEWAPTRPAEGGEERMPKPEMWLQFAGASDDSWFVVCCDLGSPLFGTAAEYMTEGHPWRLGVADLNFCGRNVLQFVTEYVGAMYGPGPSRWPDIPVEQWATY